MYTVFACIVVPHFIHVCTATWWYFLISAVCKSPTFSVLSSVVLIMNLVLKLGVLSQKANFNMESMNGLLGVSCQVHTYVDQ